MTAEDRRITRRDFIKHSTLGTIGAVACMNTFSGCSIIAVKDNYRMMSSALFGSEDPVPEGVTPVEPVINSIHSTVSVVHSANAVDGTSGKINQEIVQKMFDRAIYAYTGKDSIEEAWGEIIPDLKSTDTIGIKINCINPALPTSPEAVNAVIRHLLNLGLKENNIIVWDRADSSIMGIGSLTNSGYEMNDGNEGVRYVSNSTENMGFDHDEMIQVPSVDLTFPVSKIISKECKYLINMPQLRHHSKAGVSLCMKNYYGVIPLFDTFAINMAAEMHRDNCNPMIPELYNNPIFVKKTKLHVCDALITMYEGGPLGYPQDVIGKLMIGKDPVALDYLGLMIIEEERKKRQIGTLMCRSKYIQTAAEMGIGTNNPQQMDVREIEV